MTRASGSVVTFSRANQRAEAKRTVILVGNPNVGKSVLFGNLTDRYVTVSNFPGTTVELVETEAVLDGHTYRVIDTPGVNDLAPRNDEARVTRELLSADEAPTVVQVADAKNLRRALLLTLQLAELGASMVLVLNMYDELEERGGHIDVDRLSESLGIPVVPAVATRSVGTEELVGALAEAAVPKREAPSEPVPEVDDDYERNRSRLAEIREIMAETYSISQPRRASLGVRLGFWAMHPVKGVLFLAASLLTVFWFVGLFGAGTLVDFLEVGLFEQRLSPLAIRSVDALLPFPHSHPTETVPLEAAIPLTPIHEIPLGSFDRPALSVDYSVDTATKLTGTQSVLRFVHDFLVGDYGAITMALSYAFAIILPIVTTFFLLFSLLEDSGYLPRLAIMVNRLFRLMGLNGKAVLPMVLGLGCDTMATMTTRILETRKERVVTTLLLALAIPCSAQLGVLLAMMASLTPAGAVAWIAIMIGVLVLVGWLSSRLFGGESGEFVLEIPPMRRPQFSNIMVKTVSRINWYLREVIPLFMIGTAVLFLLDRLGTLDRLARWSQPLVSGWLGLPPEMANAFLVGFMRRDFGAVYILDAVTAPVPLLTPHQIFVAMITITLFMPCFANFLMIAKEHGQRVAWAMIAFIFPFAFLVGGLVNQLGRLF
ncbi:MAG: ferrous iron transporter B [bacterium]|nr:ferrous iron transporter B [bacterium]